MTTCRDPEHPHCTVWVMPGDGACAHGHPQPAASREAPPVRERRANIRTPHEQAALQASQRPSCPQSVRPHLRVSGFDPRAAGGRQAIRLELRGMPQDGPPRLAMLLKSALHLEHDRHALARTARGQWTPVFVEFSSRGLEHGQYRIEVELHGRGEDGRGPSRTWVCSLVVLVPRPDATLTEIHQAFLSTYKNVRVLADDASIARVNAQAGGGSVDIDVTARNAGIAHLDLDTTPGKIDLGLPTIAWDEDLVEIDVPLVAQPHPYPAGGACIANTGSGHKLRLFARDEFVLGRFEPVDPEADVLLAHHGDAGEDRVGLTRRLSARHAVIRRTHAGYELEDVSRFGLLVDGEWPGKHKSVPLLPGMRIELTASIPGVVSLVVRAVLPNGVVLHRADGGAGHESFWLLTPGLDQGAATPGLPILFHRDGGFWHRDAASGKETPLTPATALDQLQGLGPQVRFAGGPYPETWNVRARVADRRRTPAARRPCEGRAP